MDIAIVIEPCRCRRHDSASAGIYYCTWLHETGVTSAFIEPASPWQNGFVESYNGIFRYELLNIELFDSVEHAPHLTNDWTIYNHFRPHGSLRGATSAAFAAYSPTASNRVSDFALIS